MHKNELFLYDFQNNDVYPVYFRVEGPDLHQINKYGTIEKYQFVNH